MSKELTRDIIAIIVVLAAVATLFFQIINPASEQLIQTLAGLVVGYYFGIKALPMGSVMGKKLGKKK